MPNILRLNHQLVNAVTKADRELADYVERLLELWAANQTTNGVSYYNSFGDPGGKIYAYDITGRHILIIQGGQGATSTETRIQVYGQGDSTKAYDLVIYDGNTGDTLLNSDSSAGSMVLGNTGIDLQFRGTYLTGADWTPTVTNLTVGNGTWVGKRFQVGNMVTLTAAFTFGTTSAMGTEPTLTLPITATNAFAAAAGLTGTYYDASGSKYPIVGSGLSTTGVRIRCQVASGTYLTDGQITATVPFAYAAGDVLAFTLTYSVA